MIDILKNDSPAIERSFHAPPPPQPEKPDPVTPGKPGWDMRAHRYARSVLTAMIVKGVLRVIGHQLATFIRWMFDQVWRLYLVSKWRLSRRVTIEVLTKRLKACEGCEGVEKIGFKRFCRPCGCPNWRWSNLLVKNQRRAHNCPWGKHDGSWKTKGGCSSCGGGGNKNGKHKAPVAQES